MALMNEVRLIGHCADAPTKISTQSGKLMARVAVYTAHWWRDEAGIQKLQKEIHRCLFFGSNAERAFRFLQKGTQVHLVGALHYETRENADNSKSCYADIKVQEFTVADRIMVSKEMYEKIFPGEKSHRVELSKQRYEMENFDENMAQIEAHHIKRMRGVKNAKKHF